ncbi:uncharacterized protein LOC134672281 [Cydia fagiglandana]|uniref:uncharacterized protein LOC134672281 n=1 Tax=Cydia fagiglandana TaxID=1458189 RepID=UPI002FEE0955
MAGSALDELPRWSWLLGFDLRSATLIIATIGIIHPSAYIYSCIVHRGCLFTAAWLLAAAWCAFSVALLVGILQGLALTYECWVWFTLVFAPLMILLMGALAAHCCLRLYASLAAFCTPVLAIVFYWITLYFAFVVNSERMSRFS